MSMDQAFYSIITICKNADQYIERCIQSVLSQNYPSYEYIIVDGASTDDTLKIIDNYKDRITKIISEPDNGVSDAFNKAIKLSTGKYIISVNADDWLTQNAFRQVSQFIKKYDRYQVYCGGTRFYTDDRIETESLSNWKRIHEETSIHHASVVIRKDAFEEYGYFDSSYKYAMDYELFLRFYKNKVKFLNIPIIVANRQLGGVSYTNSIKALKETRRARLKYFSRYNSNWVFLKSMIKDYLGRFLKAIPYFRKSYQKYWKRKNQKIQKHS